MNLYRENHKRLMAEPVAQGFIERRGWWRRNGDYVGLILWSIVGLLVFSEAIIAYGTRLPR